MKRNEFQIMIASCRWLTLVAVLLSLTVWHSSGAASVYENNAVTTDPIPIPDATNFINNNTFTITFPDESLYQTHDTLNYTNNNDMIGDFGFYFDDYSTKTSLNYEAGTFNNQNTIECGAEMVVWATNIINPGWTYIYDGAGQISLTGNNVDLSDTTMAIESTLTAGIGNVFSEDYGVGTDTKGEWVPASDLTTSSALSSLYRTLNSPNLVNTLQLVGSTYNIDTKGSSSNIIYRAVFVQDENSVVTHNVYFSALPDGSQGIVTVGWSGVYTNIATGQTSTNYLYLQDEPVLVWSNNVNLVSVINGIPNNYTIQASQVPLLTGAAPQGTFPTIPPGNITNNYSYLEAQLQPTTVPTNSLVMTNVAAIEGRVEISASHELNLNNAIISGPNYMSLVATNQFDGNLNASISAPFSDIALAVTNGNFMQGGVTNGNLSVSNLLEPNLPIWSGTVQAWSTRWIVMTTNVIGTNSVTVTNDFRVELVLDDIAPTSPSQVKNLTLTGTNSLQISDTFNIFGDFLLNTRSLTLTTNGIDNGAQSEFGVLNLENNNVLSPSSVPYLQFLTNNGAINVGNQALFGSAAPTFVTNKIPAVPGISATGYLSEVHGVTNVLAENKVVIGTNTYTFVKKVTNSIPDQVKIGKNFGVTMTNLIAAINHSDGAGDGLYSSKTVKNVFVTASRVTNGTFYVTAIVAGTNGNNIITTTTSSNLLWNTNLLSGGVNPIPLHTNIVALTGPYQAFVNSGTITDFGSQIYADYFANGGLFENESGPFTLTAGNVLLTNGTIYAYFPFPSFFTNGYSGDITISATNLVVSNLLLAAGGGLTLQVSNVLTDTGPGNGNLWYLDGGSSLLGLNLPIRPASGDLSGTSITMFTPSPNKPVRNYWSAIDYGVSTAGYTNNDEIGQLTLDVTSPQSSFYFSGPAGSKTNNAIYVDQLVLQDYASYANGAGTANIPTLFFNTNLVIYYADAVASSTVTGGSLEDVSYLLNGSNTNHLRWVPQYTGFFSTTNIVYPNGQTYAINIGLALSGKVDSIGNGQLNYQNPYPVFEPSQVNFQFAITNVPPLMALLTWDSIPSATNTIYYATNLSQPYPGWLVVTNFVSPGQILTPSTWPITNVLVEPLDLTTPHGYYRVRVSPNAATVYP